ncbi:contractile injection system tape measure protein [Cellvibrio sp. OA-2007]|uniref:contractile injection system tape measure protein n=1 Tax=Cellvibrio sp. OA-2007 TaxID=529823 RepID=UPI00078640BF|nr:contractile injection system tape measure protein [Cellvibrio sp. OA-2007]
MQTEHRIDELIVDLSFNTTRLARHETAQLNEWLTEDLLPALDRVFSHYSPGTQILRFETLEFDCGSLTSRHYQQAIREQLLKQFAQLLASQLLAVAPENTHLQISTAQRDTPNAELALKQLFSYLATGQLSAHRPVVQQQTSASKNKQTQSPGLHAQLLDAVIAQHNIADLLRELPQRDLLIQRLLTQFTLLQRMELLRQLAPQQVQNAIALFDLLQLLGSNYRIYSSHAKDQSIIAGSTIEPTEIKGSTTERLMAGDQLINYDSLGSDAVQQTVWEALLELALAQPQATTQFWINQILHKLASKFAFSENQLRQDLVAIKRPSGAAAKALEDLQAVIANSVADTSFSGDAQNFAANQIDNPVYPASASQSALNKTAQPSASGELPIDHEQQSTGQLQQLVAAALIRADVSQLQQLWPQLLANDQLFITALQHYLPQPEIRQQLMLRLPVDLQAGIIALLAPALTDIFYRLQQCATQLNYHIVAQLKSFTSLTARSEDNSQNENKVVQQSAELVARQLWEITLGLLFNGSSINSHYQGQSKVFINAVAQRYAELHNLDEQRLQQLLQTLVFGQQQDEASSSDDISSEKTESINAGPDGINPTAELQQNQQILQKNEELQKNQLLLKNQEQQSSYPVSNATLASASVAPDTSDFAADTYHFTADASGLIADSVRLNSDTTRFTANSLVSVSDHQLFDLCLRLKSGALAWSSLAADVVLLQRLISSYIRLGHSATAENCAEFVAAIDAQAESSYAPATFYLTVLKTLIADKLIDLELIAQTVQRNNNSPQVNAEIPEAVTSVVKHDIEAITQELLRDTQPLSRLQQLQLNTIQWQELTFELLKRSSVTDAHADLIAAIEIQTRWLLNPTLCYRRIIQAILQHQSIDLEAFGNESTENPVNAITQTGGRDLPQQAQVVEKIPQNSSVHSQDQNGIASTYTTAATDPIASIVKTLTIDTWPLSHLQQLQLDATQWQELACELIKHNAVANVTDVADITDVASNTELIAAIKSQARSALNPIIYYRQIIQAVLQQQPIDLEAFSATNADQQYTSANSSVNNLTQEVTIATHADHPEYFNSESPGSKSLYLEQAIDYSLSTGADTSVRKPALSLAQLFAANQPLTQEQLLMLQQHVNLLLNHPNPTLVAEWSELLTLANNAQLLIQLVPSHLLHQIMLRLQPARYAALDAVVKVVLEAMALLVNDLNNPAIKQARWEFIIRYLLTVNDNQIVTASSELAQTLSIDLCEHLATAAGINDLQRLVNLTQRRIALLKPVAQQKPAMRLQEINTNPATQSDESTPQWESGLHINNAGQVLAGAFLPRLFSMLNLIQDGKFIHPGAADRAVHLVQFMVTGEACTPEYDLILNKILCGISTSIPVSAGIEITEQEQTLIEQMLTSMIQHWKVLGSTSIAGLRETFFQRQGWLVLEEDCWRLKVKEQTFDLLLDRLPWSISLIKHGWMDKPLRVSWRNHS